MPESIVLSVKFHSFWHCGSGGGQSAESDLTPVKDRYGLPYVPGRTLKGVIRDALRRLHDLGHCNDYFNAGAPVPHEHLFGSGSQADSAHSRYRESVPGRLAVGSAELGATVVDASRAQRMTLPALGGQLFRSVHMTALEADAGVALDKSLRVIDVAVPIELQAVISWECSQPSDPNRPWVKLLKMALPLVTGIGAFRQRGFGRVTVEVS